LSAALVLAFAAAGWAAADPDGPAETSLATDDSVVVLEDPAGQEARSSRPSPPAPIGLRHGEALDGKQLRLAYSFERLWHQDILVGSKDRTSNQARNGFWKYDKVPRRLDITIHSFDLAYAPHPRVTLVVEVPLVQRKLRRIDRLDVRSQDETTGVGDVAFSVVVPFIKKGGESSQVHAGFTAPTGSIRRSANNSRLPYDSQIGIGSWALEWGLTYRGEWKRLAWGGQFNGLHPVRRNSLNYRAGSRFDASIWSGFRIFRGVSTSVRLSTIKQNNFRGRDRSLDIEAEGPSANHKKRGGFRLDFSPGLTIDLPELGNQRLSVEFSLPIYQDLDGPQVAREYSMKAGWQWDF